MNTRYLFVLLVVLCAAADAFAQKGKSGKKESEETELVVEDDDNYVPNGSFENLTEPKTLKGPGQIKDVCKPWETPNSTPADIFSSGVKAKVSVPANDYGTQIPADGQNYAGFRAFNKDPKKTRTYLQVKLKRRLIKDQLYCVKFQLSLSDLSKVGVNNVGLFISDRKVINTEDQTLNYTPQIMERTNKAITNLDGWETICGTYVANGNEEYIVIGGFGAEDKMKQEKAKKPATQAGVVMNEAYYYIDNIEIKEIKAASQCICGKEEAKVPDLIYSKVATPDENLTPAEKLDGCSVYFPAFSADVPAMFDEEISKAADLMKNNPSLKVILQGHTENEEADEAKIKAHLRDLAARRAEAVKNALVSKGVDASRIVIESKENTMPANTRPTPLSKAQNRRVEFNLK